LHNSNGVPKNFLIVQAVFVSLLSFVFLFMPTVNSAYWVFMVLVTQLYLIMYLLLFGAAIKLRYTHAHVPRPFSVPGGIKGMWILGSIGFASSVFALLVCFFPPAQIPAGDGTIYIASLIAAIALFVGLPFWISKYRARKALESV
jgi:amino acid transporter